jgi:hypothetical protein
VAWVPEERHTIERNIVEHFWTLHRIDCMHYMRLRAPQQANIHLSLHFIYLPAYSREAVDLNTALIPDLNSSTTSFALSTLFTNPTPAPAQMFALFVSP